VLHLVCRPVANVTIWRAGAAGLGWILALGGIGGYKAR